MNTENIAPSHRLFPLSKAATNMPFFDGTTLAFCQSTETTKVTLPTTGTIWKQVHRNTALAAPTKNLPRTTEITYRPWKLAYCNWNDKIIHPINTGLPAKYIERCPSFYPEGDQVHFSFVSGIPTSAGFFYRLYTCSGPDLEHLDTPRAISSAPTYFGFVSPHHICRGIMNVIQLTEKATNYSFTLHTSFHRVVNVIYLAENPTKLLITGLLNRNHDYQTIQYDLSTGELSEVSAGKPAYKATLHGEQLIFANKRKGEFEDRELYYGPCSFAPCSIQISKD